MTQLDDLPLRDDLRGLTPYGAPQEQHGVITINVNENPYPVPEQVALHAVAEVARVLPGLNRYPDREFSELREKLANYLGHSLTADQIWAANGSNEVLQQLLQAFAGPGRSVMGFAPTYSMYPLLAQGVGSTWIAAERDGAFELSAATVTQAIRSEQPDVVILCTPNNPTGTPIALEVIEAALHAAPGMVIVDEAYAEFRPDGEPSALELLPAHPRLVVSRTMSKAFAYAGVRLGYFAADPAVADAVRLVRLPYHLSAITQAVANAALDYSEVMLGQVDRIRVQRDRLVDETRALGFSPYRSSANFVLIDGFEDSAVAFAAIRERGILVRDNGIPHTLRVSAGTEAETTAFLEVLAELAPSVLRQGNVQRPGTEAPASASPNGS